MQTETSPLKQSQGDGAPRSMEKNGDEQTPSLYIEKGRAQTALQGLPSGSVRLFNFSPPYLDAVDYESAGEVGDNRYAWDNLANDSRAVEKAESNETEEEPTTKVADYIDRHLKTCREIKRVAADVSTVCIEIDDYRIDGEYHLIGLTSLWRRMLEEMGFRVAERITLGREIAVSRRGAHLMREEGEYRRPGYYAPANVTSTLLVAFRGNVQERLRTDGREEEAFDKEYAKDHMKSLWTLEAPGQDRMDRKGHPCPQALRVARAAVRFYSVEGDLVCDPYAGVGTTGVAALEEGRSAALIEPIERFCNDAQQKIEQRMGVKAQRIGESGNVVVPGAQLRLPMVGSEIKQKIRQEAYPGEGEPTERHQEMAEEIADMIGMGVPPSLVSTFLRAERSVVKKRRERKK